MLIRIPCTVHDLCLHFQESNFYRAFEFDADFGSILRRVENDAKKTDVRKKNEMRSFDESAKSKKSIGSMIENNKTREGAAGGKKKGVNFREADEAEEEAKAAMEAEEDAGLDEETRMANLNALKSKIGKKGQSVSQLTI